MNKTTATVPVVRWEGGQVQRLQDEVVVEATITLYYNDRELVNLLATPLHLEELAVGYLLGEGLVQRRDTLSPPRVHAGQGWVAIRGPDIAPEPVPRGHRYLTTGGGRGSAFLSNLGALESFPPAERSLTLKPEALLRAVRGLHRDSQLFRRTGGVHGAALESAAGPECFRADIGRHNAVDKIAGYCYLQGIGPSDMFLLLSGRVSSEIVLKAARMGLATVVSPAAPTERAVELALRLGMTLVGFARDQRFNVYSGEGRIRLQSHPT